MKDPKEAPLLEHLEELRSRLAKALLWIFIFSVISFIWANALFAFLTAPLVEAFSSGGLIGTGPAEAFFVKLKVSILSGFILSTPITFYHAWRFIAPGLYSHEQRMALPFVFFTTVFFLTGLWFCFFVVLPFAFAFFVNEYNSIGVKPTIRIVEYLSFTIRLLLVFGVIFEMPVLSYFLTRIGLLTHTWLITKARFALVGVFVVAAILTPPDIATQVLLALPLIILYGLCIGIAYVVGEREQKE